VTVDRQTQGLLDLVEADRRQKCQAIVAEAQAEADVILRQAHADARARMRKAIEEERLRRDARVDAARANLQTRRRLADQQRDAALLAAGWKALPDELLRRWRTPDLRRLWVSAVVASARASLPGSEWRIAHAPDWPAAEREEILAGLVAARGSACVLGGDTGIRAGLRISANGNVVDGTLDGLLADRAETASQLLHLLGSGAQA